MANILRQARAIDRAYDPDPAAIVDVTARTIDGRTGRLVLVNGGAVPGGGPNALPPWWR